MHKTIKQKNNKCIVVVLGPTASGKSDLAVKLALWLRKQAKRPGRIEGLPSDAEVISADSRQVYRGLDIGTAKVPGRWQWAVGSGQKKRRVFVYKNIPHHLIDFVSPQRTYSAAEYADAARKVLQSLVTSHSLPIICGGTGHYIDMLLGTQSAPDVPPDLHLRAKLEKLSNEELFARLKRLDPRRAANIDRHNPRRLIRALEIVLKTGRPVPKIATPKHSNILKNVGMFGNKEPTEILKIGLCPSPIELRRRINARLEQRMRQGLVAEVRKLHSPSGGGLSWKRLDALGLEYRYVARHVRGRMTYDELLTTLRTEIWRYAKRQLQWFKRDKSIVWTKNEREALRLARRLLG